ncbi:MAG: aldo/keto reductase [Anaerolineae bacterium]|nr:aldo/keto reductase [Anaerolineae bacterium]
MSEHISSVPFSRLVVGTVQFGLPYGIANRVGQPSLDQVCEILSCAVEGGATTLDTAAAYGESEQVLGRALRAIGALDQVTLISKVRQVKYMGDEPTWANVRRWLRGSVRASLDNLDIEYLPLCLFHDTADVVYLEELLQLKEEGLIGHVGASVFSPEQLPKVLDTEGIEAVQIAASMLDQRILRAGLLDQAVERGIAVFVRSVFLQGLLVMPVDQIRPELRAVAPVRHALQQVCDRAGLTMPEMALRYGLSIPGVTGVLTGVETAAQMAANVSIAARGPLPADVVAAIDRAVPDLPHTLLNPFYWPGAMR